MGDNDNYTPGRRRVGMEGSRTPQRSQSPPGPDGSSRTGQRSQRYQRDTTRTTGFDLRVDPKDGGAGTPGGGTSSSYNRTTRSTAAPAQRAHRRTRGRSRELLSWVLSIALAVLAAFAIRGFVFEIILVDGESMEPTLHTDERLGIEKITRYTKLPSRGDIIIVKYPNMDGTYVKRTIGLPGETVEVRNSTVYIDGVPLDEDYVSSEPYADMAPVVVPPDSVFVMGDNRAHSMDSRASYIGAIPRSDIIGHGMFVMWPLENIHMIDHAEFPDRTTSQG